MRIAVIVPVHNGATTLGRCLDAISASSRRPDHVLVADDASTDGSAMLATIRGVETFRTGETPKGPGIARNMAIARLDTDIVVLVDADVEIHRDAIARLIAPLEGDETIGASFGSYDDAPEGPNLAGIYTNLRHHVMHQAAREEAQSFWSGLGATRVSAIRDAGGFSSSYSSPSIEDIELGSRIRRQGWRIRLVRDAQGKHLKNWSLRQLWHTDIFKRAIPWSRLVVDGRGPDATLNLRPRERLAAALAGTGTLMALFAPIAPLIGIGALACALGWLIINRHFAGLMTKRAGWRGLVFGMMLHWIYYLYSAAAYIGVRLIWRAGEHSYGQATDGGVPAPSSREDAEALRR